MNPETQFEALKSENKKQKLKALAELSITDPIDFLMELAILFEKRHGTEEKLVNLQVASVTLSKLLKDAFQKITFCAPEKNLDEIQVQLLKCLKGAYNQGINPKLEQLYNLYEIENLCDQLEQIHLYDDHCEVDWFEEGGFKTRIKDFKGLKNYCRDGLKWEELIEFYTNKGRWTATKMVENEKLFLPGKNEDDRADAFDHVARQIGTLAYLEHYGVEEKFEFKGSTYHTSLLVQILSFLIIYTRSRYGYLWEMHGKESNIAKRILNVWQINLEQDGRETPGPLFISTWSEFVARTKKVIGEVWPEEDIEHHLSFFSVDLESLSGYLNILETPLLRYGDWVVFFARPLMYQNSWISILKPLVKTIKGKQPEGAQHRNKLSTLRLAKKFKEHEFSVLTDVDLITPGYNKPCTDVDIFALKDSCLFLIQVKMTFPGLTMKDINDHRKNALAKGAEQTQKSLAYFKNHWRYFCQQCSLPEDLNWESLEVVPLIVSTSTEWDRNSELGFTKISQFELERYLENDAGFLHFNADADFIHPDGANEYLFYPKDEQVSGKKLKALIEENALWEFLEPKVDATSLDRFLLGFYNSNSPASQAQEYFINGNDRYNDGQFDKSAALFRLAIYYFPYEEAYYKGLGNALAMSGKRRNSLEFFDKALELNPFFGEAYNVRGLTYQELHEYDKAYNDFIKAIEYSPYDISAWSNLSRLQIMRGEKWFSPQLIEDGIRLGNKGLSVFEQLDPVDQAKLYIVAMELQKMILSFQPC